jgi:hypothetical protein
MLAAVFQSRTFGYESDSRIPTELRVCIRILLYSSVAFKKPQKNIFFFTFCFLNTVPSVQIRKYFYSRILKSEL